MAPPAHEISSVKKAATRRVRHSRADATCALGWRDSRDGRMKVSVSQATDRPRDVLYLVAALSLLSALIHLWVMPEHFEE